jgi:hypothetical protein
MRRRVYIALAVLLVMLAGVIAWQVLRLREPVYQGKRLSYWLEILVQEQSMTTASPSSGQDRMNGRYRHPQLAADGPCRSDACARWPFSDCALVRPLLR